MTTKVRVNKEIMLRSKLEVAYENLRRQHIIARHNYCCCGSCGMAAMNAKVEKFEAAGKPVRGVVFYHEQDKDRLRETNSVYLCYDGHGDIDATVIGHEIVTALRDAGYQEADIEWDGNAMTRIRINNVLAY